MEEETRQALLAQAQQRLIKREEMVRSLAGVAGFTALHQVSGSRGALRQMPGDVVRRVGLQYS